MSTTAMRLATMLRTNWSPMLKPFWKFLIQARRNVIVDKWRKKHAASDSHTLCPALLYSPHRSRISAGVGPVCSGRHFRIARLITQQSHHLRPSPSRTLLGDGDTTFCLGMLGQGTKWLHFLASLTCGGHIDLRTKRQPVERRICRRADSAPARGNRPSQKARRLLIAKQSAVRARGGS